MDGDIMVDDYPRVMHEIGREREHIREEQQVETQELHHDEIPQREPEHRQDTAAAATGNNRQQQGDRQATCRQVGGERAGSSRRQQGQQQADAEEADS